MNSIEQLASKIDLRTGQGGELFIEELLKLVKEQVEAEESLTPFAILLGSKDPETNEPEKNLGIHYVELAHLFSPESQGTQMSFVQSLASKVEGFCASLVAETWIVRQAPEEPPPVGALYEAPNRQKAVIVQFEHFRLGTRMYVANLQENGGKRLLEEFSRPNVKMRGSLISLLGYKQLN